MAAVVAQHKQELMRAWVPIPRIRGFLLFSLYVSSVQNQGNNLNLEFLLSFVSLCDK